MAVSFIQKAMVAAHQKVADKDLIEVLVKNMGKYEKERSHETVHASDVTDPKFCPRQVLLQDLFKVKNPDRFIPAALRATFDLGHSVAAMVVEDWMGEAARGLWRCRHCYTLSKFGSKPKQCHCEHHEFSYVESAFFGENCAISGSIDLLADLGHPKLTVVELKIMKDEDFNKLAAPLAEHRLRTRLYLHLIAQSSNPHRFLIDTERAKVLYVSRGYGKMHSGSGQILPFKEFDVERDDQSVQVYIDRGQRVKFFRESGGVDTEKVCENALCATAKKCPVRAQCWSGEVP